MTAIIAAMDYRALGRAVERERLRRGWSKEGAARRADISSITWKRVEDGLPVQDAKLAAVLAILELDSDGSTTSPADSDELESSFVTAPGLALEDGATNDEVVAAIREMADAIREMNEGNRRLLERLERQDRGE